MHVEAHPTEADTVFVMNASAWKSIDGGKNFDEFHTPHGDNHGPVSYTHLTLPTILRV